MKFEKKYITGKFPFVVGVVIVVCIAIIYKMVMTMTVDKDKWMDFKSENVDGSEVPDPPTRGNILSDEGDLLSTSMPKYNVRFDFLSGVPALKKEGVSAEKFIKDSLKRDSIIIKKNNEFLQNIDEISAGIAKLCPEMGSQDSVRAHLMKGLNSGSRYYDICKGHVFDFITYQELRQLPIFNKPGKYASGIQTIERNHREKPFGSLASRTIGAMYGLVDSAVAGIELQYDSLLKGKPGLKRQRLIRSKDHFVDIPLVPPTDGLDVVSTINVTMQDICESALREKLIEVEADFGVCILMDVHTGDVKALVNLRKVADGKYEDDQNLAVSALMEPGSTFKTASIMVALDDGEININDRVDTGGGEVNMHGRRMRDDGGRGHGIIDVTAAMRYSSNIGVSKLIDSHYHGKPQQFVDGLKRIGIGGPLGFDIPGTANPRIYGPKENKTYWSDVSLPWMAIGYNTQIPPISTCTFYNAIANNGRMVRPRVVKGLSKNGEMVEEFPVQVINEHICRDTTLRTMQAILKDVVNGDHGTGRRVKSKYFYVSGKTGTAQVADEHGGYHSGNSRHFVSFCGYYPSDNPQYTCLVGIKTAFHPVSGGSTAGTVFLKIAEQVYSKHVTTNIMLACDTLTYKQPPIVMDGNMNAARNVLSILGINTLNDSTNGTIWGTAVRENNMLMIKGRRDDYAKMPDLKGMGARDALYALGLRGAKVRISGCGKVQEQSIAAGTEMKPGMAVTLKLG